MKKNNAKYLLVTLLIIFCLIALLVYLKDQAPPAGDQLLQTTEALDYYPAHTPDELVVHTYFALVYAEKDEQARWVAYHLTPEMIQSNTERSDDFRQDSLVLTGSATPDDYRRSGYDRGHLVPAGDMGFSEQAMSESFLMSNISPQAPAFNRGIWKDLEEQTRNWVKAAGSLYVVTGPVLKKRRRKKIGENAVTVPSQFYKILLHYRVPERARAIAFLMPNQDTQKPLLSFVVSIDEVEAATGLDFFPALPDTLEATLEAEKTPEGWFSLL